MKTKFIILILSILCNSTSYSQTSKELSKSEIEKLNFDIKKLKLPLLKIIEYSDKNGVFDIFLLENTNLKVQTICYQQKNRKFQEKWQINDFLTDNPERGLDISITFLEEYCSFNDIDGDKIIDPIIVYATTNGYEEWQHIKIITIYKNKKYVIRAQECVLDYCRTFNKDAIKKLPKPIQANLESLLQTMRVEKDLILSNG